MKNGECRTERGACSVASGKMHQRCCFGASEETREEAVSRAPSDCPWPGFEQMEDGAKTSVLSIQSVPSRTWSFRHPPSRTERRKGNTSIGSQRAGRDEERARCAETRGFRRSCCSARSQVGRRRWAPLLRNTEACGGCSGASDAQELRWVCILVERRGL